MRRHRSFTRVTRLLAPRAAPRIFHKVLSQPSCVITPRYAHPPSTRRRGLATAPLRSPLSQVALAVGPRVLADRHAVRARAEALPPAERAAQTELVLGDFIVAKPHVADPSLVFEGLIGCEQIKTRLAEYRAVLEAAARIAKA